MGDGTEIWETTQRNVPWAGIEESMLEKCLDNTQEITATEIWFAMCSLILW